MLGVRMGGRGVLVGFQVIVSFVGILRYVSRLIRMHSLDSGVLFPVDMDVPAVVSGVALAQEQTSKLNRIPVPGFPGYDPEAPTVVVDMSGGMANTLSFLATGLSLIWWMEQSPEKVSATLALRTVKEHVPAWQEGQADVQRCFPWTRNLNFSSAQGAVVRHRIKDPGIKWLDSTIQYNHTTSSSSSNNGNETVSPEHNIRQFLESYRRKRSRPSNPERAIKLKGFMNQPMYLVTHMTSLGKWADVYYDKLREAFHFDTEQCCATKPAADESVFHFRNFAKEVGRWKTMGFAEIGPNRTVSDLFGHLRPGDKVAITTRFSDHSGGDGSILDDYLTAFRHRGIQARVISGQSGVEDFCFLLSAQKEIVGVTKSTFFVWAALLGQARIVRAYQANVLPGPRGNGGSHGQKPYHWQNPQLVRRFRYHVYDVNTTTEYQI